MREVRLRMEAAHQTETEEMSLLFYAGVGKMTPCAMSTDEIVAELDQRVKALYQLNLELAAQVDRMRPVVDFARTWHANDKGFTRIALHNAVSHYNTAMAQLAKESE